MHESKVNMSSLQRPNPSRDRVFIFERSPGINSASLCSLAGLCVRLGIDPGLLKFFYKFGLRDEAMNRFQEQSLELRSQAT
jgi:hypothetical protein